MVEALLHQMSNTGFVTLERVPDYDEDELFRAVKAFHHDIPLEEKDKLKLKHFNQKNTNIYRGFFPFLDNDVSHKEMYDMCRPLSDYTEEERKSCPLYEETPWVQNDPEKKYTWIRETFDKYYRIMQKVAVDVVGFLAEGLGKSSDYFDPWFKEECSSTFRVIHYLPRNHERAGKSDELAAKDRRLTTPEHSDSGFVTLLSTFGYPGLQAEIGGEWKSLATFPNTLVVNLGATLSRISDEKIKATKHRVLDIGRERFSCPFFLEPKFSAKLYDDIIDSGRKQCEDKEFD